MTKLVFSLLFVVLKLQVAKAQTTGVALTLDAAIAEASGRSPEIAKQRAIKDERDGAKFAALGQGFLPKLSLDAHHFLNKQYPVTTFYLPGGALSMPGAFPTDAAALHISIPLFDGLANVRHWQAATLEQSAASAELSYAEFTLREEVRLAFYRALAAAQLQDVATQNVKTLEDHLKQVEAQRSGGVATSYDVLRVQVQLNEAKADAIDAVDNVETSRRKLTQYLGLEADLRSLTGQLPIPQLDRVKDLKFEPTGVVASREDLHAMGLHAEAAHRETQARKAWLSPQLSLGGEYGYYNAQVIQDRVGDTGRYQTEYSLGIFLKWDLFDGGVALARQRETVARQTQAEKKAAAARLQVPYDFEYWKRRYVSNTDHYISKTFDTKRSEESVRLSKEEEKAGSRTSTETLDAELDLFRAKAGVVNALVNSAEAQIRLEIALGKEI